MLMKLTEEIADIEEETQELIKSELKKAFEKHIEDIIEDLLKGDLDNLNKSLDITEDGKQNLEAVTNLLNVLKECKKKLTLNG